MRTTVSVILALLVAMVIPAAAQIQYGTQCAVTPAALGAGPAAQLVGLSGPTFDLAYMQAMYQQHRDIAVLANLGASRSTDPDLKDLSSKILNEQTDLNRKLSQWFTQSTGTIPAVDPARVQQIAAGLNCSDNASFNANYALAMSTLLNQEAQAATLAQSQAVDPNLRYQAGVAARSATNESQALGRWLQRSAADPPGYYPSYGRYYSPYYARPNYGSYYGRYYSPYYNRPYYNQPYYGQYSGRYYQPYPYTYPSPYYYPRYGAGPSFGIFFGTGGHGGGFGGVGIGVGGY